MEIIYSKSAVKAISRMDSATKQRVKQGIEAIPGGDIKPLRGSDGTYRLRVGDWRILFEYETHGLIRIKKVAPRGGVYKGV